MKTLKVSTFLLFISLVTLMAQAPPTFNYQAVIRDADGQLVSNESVNLKISILKGATDGSLVYEETHITSTNVHGQVNLQVGNGISSDDMADIDWSVDDYFINVKIDPSGGTNYTLEYTSQLVSVPFAMYAAKAGAATNLPDFEGWDQNQADDFTGTMQQNLETNGYWLSHHGDNEGIYIDSTGNVHVTDTILSDTLVIPGTINLDTVVLKGIIQNGNYYINPSSGSKFDKIYLADKIYDYYNSSFYIDPSSVSRFNSVYASSLTDYNDHNYYLNPSIDSKLNDLQVGGNGVRIDEIQKLTGNTGHERLTTGTGIIIGYRKLIPLPSGYDKNNAFILSVKIIEGNNSYSLGYEDLWYHINESSIDLRWDYNSRSRIKDSTYKIIIMKVD